MKQQKVTRELSSLGLIVVIYSIVLIMVVSGLFHEGAWKEALLAIAFIGTAIADVIAVGYRGVKKCYIEMGNDQLVVVRPVKKLKSDNKTPEGKWIEKKDIFDVKDIVRMGYTWDLYKKRMEYQRDVSEKLKDKEVVFELKDGRHSVINLGLFGGNKQKEILCYIHERTGLWPEGSLFIMTGQKQKQDKQVSVKGEENTTRNNVETITMKKEKLGNQYDANNKAGARAEIDVNILFQNKMKPLSEEEAKKYSKLWIEKIKAKRWKLSLLLCLMSIPMLAMATFVAVLDPQMRKALYIMGGLLLQGIIGFTVFYQIGAKSQVVLFEVTPYERGLCAIIEYTGKYKPICVQYVADGEIIEEYLNENSVCGELQVGQYATLIMVNDTPEHLLCQDISWAGM